DSASGAFSQLDNFSADAVVLVPPKTLFAVADSPHGTAGIAASRAFMLPGHFLLDRLPRAVMLLADILDVLSADSLAVAGGGDIDDAEVYTDEVANLNRRLIRQVDRAQQVELAVSIDEITLAFDP